MSSFISFSLILIAGYAASTLVFKILRTKYAVPSGIEYIFLGIILGPYFANWILKISGIYMPTAPSHEISLKLMPGVAAAIGYLGFLYGMNFTADSFKAVKREHFRLAFSRLLIPLIIIGSASYFFLTYLNPGSLFSTIESSLIIAVITSMISVSGIITVIDRYGAKGNISSALTNVSVISLNLSLLLYGIMFCIFQYDHLSVKPGTLTEWVLASIFIAAMLGVLFFIFLGREENPNKLLVSVIGITILAGGAAYYINFSPFVMNFIIGAVLANLAKNKNKLRDSLHALRYPFEILVIISAGFFWAIPNFLIFISTIALFIILRFISIYIAGKFAYKTAFDKEDVHPDIWQGLLPQGIVTAALAADYSISFKNEFMTVILSAILGSLIFFELISYVRIKNLLVDADEISGEKK